jgi:arylsulfatase A-like enzyme
VIRAGLDRVALLAWLHLGVLAVLRLCWLLRPDPFGQPLVGKPDWYLFHAVANDARQTAWLAAVGLAIASMGAARLGGGVFVALATAATLCSVVDQEAVRFLGSHLTFSLLATYGNAASIDELPHLLRHDLGGAQLPWLLLCGGCGATAGLGVWALRRPLPERAPCGKALVFAGFVLAGWLLTEVVWPGDHRAWRVASALDVLRSELRKAPPRPFPDSERTLAVTEHQGRMRAADPALQFPASKWPVLHVTPHWACRWAPKSDGELPLHVACSLDGDGDGVALADDCDDANPAVHPGARDVPSDGIDQDCDGADAAPWNFLVLVLESHRAADVGHAWSADSRRPPATSTPELDALANQGLSFQRATANGLPTIASFMALHTGLLPQPWHEAATAFAQDRLVGLPAVLRRHGYHARFFSAADPAWDNQSAWLRQWYDAVDYDRSREEDGPLFDRVADWLRHEWPAIGRRKDGSWRPLLAVVTTRTNHFPFERIAGVPKTGDESWRSRIRDTMRYTDTAMGRLLSAIRSEPWFGRTVVVVTGDHGFPMGEHGYFKLHETVHAEAVGVPLVFVGDHPELRRWQGVRRMDAASHVDVAPTILDLAGIDGSGAWQGRSLVRSEAKDASAVVLQWAQMALETGCRKLIVPADPARAEDPKAWRHFDRCADPAERVALQPSVEEKRPWSQQLRRAEQLQVDLYERDRFWPPWVQWR